MTRASNGEYHPLVPAQAGVILYGVSAGLPSASVPRASGGDPSKGTANSYIAYCSPRKRG